MTNDLHIFRNGISGYAPQGSTGSSGADGYSVHYSSFDSSEQSISDMLLLISQKKVLSTNPNYGVGVKINYKLGKNVKEDRENWIVCEKKELAVVETELYIKVNKK